MVLHMSHIVPNLHAMLVKPDEHIDIIIQFRLSVDLSNKKE